MKKFLLMDGSSLFYRAFYALPWLTAPNGESTGGIVGFSAAVLKMYSEFQPEAIGIALDVGKKTFRNEIFGEYKGNRSEMPSELALQFPMLDEFASAVGIKTVGVKNFEADDVIGTLSAQAAAQGFSVLIVTGDRDALQLIEPNVRVILLKNANSYQIYDTEKFIAEYEFEPARLIDFKGLRGDMSDNIPGIAGIGPKIATQLINRFGTVENIFAHIGAIEKVGIRQKLIDNKEIALMSKRLATINREVPDIQFDADAFSIKPNLLRADEFCNRLALNTIKKKLHALFDSTDNLFGMADEQEEVEPVPPYLIELPFVFNLKNILHAGIKLPTSEVYDVDIMNYLLDPSAPLVLHQPLADYGNALLKRLRAEQLIELYNNIELPLVEVLARMEERGVFVNLAKLEQKSAEMSEKITAIEQHIYELAGQSFKLNSPKQLSEILFDKLKLTPVKRNKSGFSTDAEVLSEIRDQHPIVEAIIDYRALSKLKSTFLDGIKPLINPETHRVHTHFNQTVTATGRLSSSDPNLQNIPIRTAEGRAIRMLFEADEGFDFLVSADYSQIELRLLAHMSGDENLIDAFNRGQDIHARTAAEVFNIPLEEVTADLRHKAKAVNFGIIYGLSDYGLAKGLHIHRKEAAEYIEKYFERYPRVKRYLDETIENARRDGFVTTMFGRRRALPFINDKSFNRRTLAERMAMNTPIQGTAADIIKIAMIDTEKNLAALKSRMILQVHDELVIETAASELEEVKSIVRRSMEGAAQLKIPLVVDIAVGRNWAEAK